MAPAHACLHSLLTNPSALCHTTAVPPVAVAGIGLQTPLGSRPAELLDSLCAGNSAFVSYQPFLDASLRFPLAASVPDDTLPPCPACADDDRGTRLLHAAVSAALVDAGGAADLSALAPVPASRIALVVGTSSAGVGPFCDALRTSSRRARDDIRYGSSAVLVARDLGIRGPVITTCNVCASGALAIAEAADLVTAGIADIAIAAGFDPLEPFVAAGFDALGTLVDRPRPFRLGRRGFILGEGAAALVLARYGDIFPRHGLVLGWGASSDAHHLTAPHPDGEGLWLAIHRALRSADLEPGAIDVINAHGTGTVFNDAMEAKAIMRVFAERGSRIPLYTIKGATGHLLGAAGAVEAAVSLIAMNAAVIPPTVTQGEADPDCNVDLVANEPRRLAVRRTLSLSAGFGGANAALILAPREHPSEVSP